MGQSPKLVLNEYIGEDVFKTPNTRHAELAARYGPVYLYEFAYKGEMGGLYNVSTLTGREHVGHTEDLHYLFGGIEGVPDDISNYSTDDQDTMKRMLTLWTNFIKYKDPTPEEILVNTIWPKVVYADDLSYLCINKTVSVKTNPKYYNQIKPLFEKYASPPYFVF